MNWHEYFIYKDGDLIWKERRRSSFPTQRACGAWHTKFLGKKAGGVVSLKGILVERVQIGTAKYYVNRVVWELHNGAIPQGMIVCHKDNDQCNNRIENLTLTTAEKNSRTRKNRGSNTSMFHGVFWHKASSKWMVTIGVKGKLKYVGIFDDFAEACQVRKEAEKKYWGDK